MPKSSFQLRHAFFSHRLAKLLSRLTRTAFVCTAPLLDNEIWGMLCLQNVLPVWSCLQVCEAPILRVHGQLHLRKLHALQRPDCNLQLRQALLGDEAAELLATEAARREPAVLEDLCDVPSQLLQQPGHSLRSSIRVDRTLLQSLKTLLLHFLLLRK